MRGGGASRLRRAQLALVTSCCLAGVVLAVELPVGELLSQRSQLAQVDSQLVATHGQERQLAAQVRSLGQPATVAAIAHQDYGLVAPGQEAFVVLPSSGSGASSLATRPLPASDLVPSLVSPYAVGSSAPPAPSVRQPGLWQRVANRLEFWRWSF